ncbi:MAG: ATP-binding cassette domain-containing protein [Roseobacter sp.]
MANNSAKPSNDGVFQLPLGHPNNAQFTGGTEQGDFAKNPEQLSGAVQQRTMIAIALMARTSFAVADEPTKRLDTAIRAHLIDLFKRILICALDLYRCQFRYQ